MISYKDILVFNKLKFWKHFKAVSIVNKKQGFERSETSTPMEEGHHSPYLCSK